MKGKNRLHQMGISQRVALSLCGIAVTISVTAVLFGMAFMRTTDIFTEIKGSQIPLVSSAFSLVQESERIETVTSEIMTAGNNYIRLSLVQELKRKNAGWKEVLDGMSGAGIDSWKQRIAEDMANAYRTKTELAQHMAALVRLEEDAAEIRMRLLVLASRLNALPVPEDGPPRFSALIRQENIIVSTLLALETATPTAGRALEKDMLHALEKAETLLAGMSGARRGPVASFHQEISSFVSGDLSLFANAGARVELQKKVDTALVKDTFLTRKISRSVNSMLAASQDRMREDVTTLADELDSYQLLLVTFFPLCLALVFFVMYYMRRSVVGRLLRLNAAALGLARQKRYSDLSRVEVEGSDEIGRLACSVNTLLREISGREEALLHSYGVLEEKVDKRTAQLRRKNIALENEIIERRSVQEALEESQRRLHFLSARLLETQEEERRRIAAELHDDIGPFLVSIKFGLEAVSGRSSCPSDQKRMLLNVIDMVRNVADQLDTIRLTLRPSMLDDLGVIESLDWYCGEFSEIHQHIRLETEIYASEANIPAHLKIVIFRVTQEALTNIAKYSEASSVRISLVSEATLLRLTVLDNGKGFDQDLVQRSYENIGRGFGLFSMRERVENTEGRFTITSGPGRGTIISALWEVGE